MTDQPDAPSLPDQIRQLIEKLRNAVRYVPARGRSGAVSEERPQINVPPMCSMHQSLLVHQAGYSENDPWRSLIIMAQIALFQGASADPTFWERIGDDLNRISEVGCLACFKPDRFGEIVEAAKLRDAGAIKRLGESWLQAAPPQEEQS